MHESRSTILHAANLFCLMGIATHGERLKNAHHDFMTVIKMQLRCVSASTMCITVL